MKYFLFRLTPPRRTFMNDMTDKERRLMQEYAVFWRDLMQKGWVVLFGPVADPKGTYGIAIPRLEDGSNANALCINDPVIQADTGFSFELHPMPSVVFPEPPY